MMKMMWMTRMRKQNGNDARPKSMTMKMKAWTPSSPVPLPNPKATLMTPHALPTPRSLNPPTSCPEPPPSHVPGAASWPTPMVAPLST